MAIFKIVWVFLWGVYTIVHATEQRIDFFKANFWQNTTPAELQHILQTGADILVTGEKDRTVLMYASRYSPYPQVIEILVQAGQRIHQGDRENNRPIMQAVQNKNTDIVRILAKLGADVNARTTNNATAIMFSASLNVGADMVQVLSELGADINARDNFRMTALMWGAVYGKNAKTIQTLIQYGANPNSIESFGMTPLMLASENNRNPEIIKILLNHTQNPQAKSAEQKTAYDYIKENKYLKDNKVVKLLKP